MYLRRVFFPAICAPVEGKSNRRGAQTLLAHQQFIDPAALMFLEIHDGLDDGKDGNHTGA